MAVRWWGWQLCSPGRGAAALCPTRPRPRQRCRPHINRIQYPRLRLNRPAHVPARWPPDVRMRAHQPRNDHLPAAVNHLRPLRNHHRTPRPSRLDLPILPHQHPIIHRRTRHRMQPRPIKNPHHRLSPSRRLLNRRPQHRHRQHRRRNKKNNRFHPLNLAGRSPSVNPAEFILAPLFPDSSSLT